MNIIILFFSLLATVHGIGVLEPNGEKLIEMQMVTDKFASLARTKWDDNGEPLGSPACITGFGINLKSLNRKYRIYSPQMDLILYKQSEYRSADGALLTYESLSKADGSELKAWCLAEAHNPDSCAAINLPHWSSNNWHVYENSAWKRRNISATYCPDPALSKDTVKEVLCSKFKKYDCNHYQSEYHTADTGGALCVSPVIKHDPILRFGFCWTPNSYMVQKEYRAHPADYIQDMNSCINQDDCLSLLCRESFIQSYTLNQTYGGALGLDRKVSDVLSCNKT